jgi:DNA-binding transcriptional LysR family regulator
MDWENVRVFLAVARGGQFVAAAKRLKLDYATVSRRIAALEATAPDGRLAHPCNMQSIFLF